VVMGPRYPGPHERWSFRTAKTQSRYRPAFDVEAAKLPMAPINAIVWGARSAT